MENTPTGIPLLEFDEHYGHSYRVLERRGDIAILEMTSKETGLLLGFEVVIVQHKPERVAPSGTVIPAKETLPPSSEWGRLGWTFSKAQPEDAEEKFQFLCERAKQREKKRYRPFRLAIPLTSPLSV